MTEQSADQPAPPVFWGVFDLDGTWRPNPRLQMSAEEQRRQNVAAGYMTEDGKRLRLPLDG